MNVLLIIARNVTQMFCWPLQGAHVEHVVNNLVTIKKLIHMVEAALVPSWMKFKKKSHATFSFGKLQINLSLPQSTR